MRTGKAGLYAFEEAAAGFLGRPASLEGITTAGMTDCHIAGEVIARTTGQSALRADIQALLQFYEQLLPRHLAARQGLTLPHVREILAYCHGRPEFAVLLLTGNSAAGAASKLRHYGIDGYFDFAASSFGDDCPDRTVLARDALEKARGGKILCFPF